ncbi:HD domain-containing protein [Paenibacillus contaminans]|uniref:Phosphohydrolase n=1 Tax=Paenibacillus contaminans TaxID=450362 RepID=A0A329MGW2_9BACL|nr:HD domain-containing protein [Paenibacillus contaminans]RAV19030.1 phosphohydrolase [Paenibacillus contaminans]
MNRSAIIAGAEKFARNELAADSSGHDWWHVYRVTKLAHKLAALENADVFICTAAALLHDVADEKLNPSKEAGIAKIDGWLKENRADEDDAAHIVEIISTMSYGDSAGRRMSTLEGQIVQDADRLDALGAIGIARTFAFSGWKGQLMHDPGLPPRENMTKEEYRSGKSTAVNHFYEKLFRLKELMNTAAARQMAEERHRFMEDYLNQFYEEWDPSD